MKIKVHSKYVPLFSVHNQLKNIVDNDEVSSAPQFVRIQFQVSDCEGYTFVRYKCHNESL